MSLVDVHVPHRPTCVALYISRGAAPCLSLAGYAIRICYREVSGATGCRIWRIVGQIGSASRTVRMAATGARAPDRYRERSCRHMLRLQLLGGSSIAAANAAADARVAGERERDRLRKV